MKKRILSMLLCAVLLLTLLPGTAFATVPLTRHIYCMALDSTASFYTAGYLDIPASYTPVEVAAAIAADNSGMGIVNMMARAGITVTASENTLIFSERASDAEHILCFPNKGDYGYAGRNDAVIEKTSYTKGTPGVTPSVTVFTITALKQMELPSPINCKWSTKTATWEGVECASGYSVQLYNNGTKSGSAVLVGSDAQTYDFSAEMVAAGGYGNFSFSVTAVGDATNFTDSDESNSDIYSKLVSAPVFSPKGGVHNQKELITLSCDTPGATIRYEINAEPTLASMVYTTPFKTWLERCTVKAKVFMGDTAISDTAEESYVFKCADPVFSPVAGTYTDVQRVTLSCDTKGSIFKICYTVDGSEPTEESTEYTAPIFVSETTTIKAKVVCLEDIFSMESLINSDVATADYTISLPDYTMDFTDGAAQGWAGNKAPAAEDCSGTGWSWDHSNKILTLSGLKFETTAKNAVILPTGAKIVLADGMENTVMSAYNGAENDSYAIKSGGSPKISGKGTLFAMDRKGALSTAPNLGVGMTAQGSTNIDGSGAADYSAENNSSYQWVKIVGVPIVTSVTVSPATASVKNGSTQSFTATVNGENSPAQTVTWSVSGNSSASTTIDASGLLTIGSDETAETLTVTATSTVDTTKNGTAAVVLRPAEQSGLPATGDNTIPGSPATGDNAMPGLWIGIMLLAGAVIAATVILGRRKRAQ
ncbi:MAG: chitobiase/beta-hexosaminidase C-terminal domain-containing protein [Christensenella sp.]|nr:chitobiase/beta-hexosaminidase C-terminal domain-containing protein [Christensenella sp.]